MLRLRSLSSLVLTLALASACSGGGTKTTQVLLKIERGNAPDGIDHIDLTVTEASSVFVQSVKKVAGQSELALPTSLKVPVQKGDHGSILIAAVAFDKDGVELARGATRGEIMPDEVVTLVLAFGMFPGDPPDGGPPDGSPPDSSPPDAGEAVLAATPVAHDFGVVATTSSGAPASFTISNRGASPSGALTARLVGTDAQSFAIDLDPANCEGESLAAGASCQLSVRFQPDHRGMLTGSLEVSGTPGGIVQIALTGTSVTPGALGLSPAMHDFGAVVDATAGPSFTFMVGNPGGSATGALTTTLGGVDASQFVLERDDCAGHPLAAAASCAIVVHFAPAGIGARTASLTVTGSPGGAQNAMLMGRGIRAASLGAMPAQQDFGTTVLGNASDVVVTISNPGGVATGMLAASIGGGDAPSFSIQASTCQDQTLAAGGSCTITVRFQPTTMGAKASTLTIMGGVGQSITVALTGTAVTPGALVLTPASQGFGGVLDGSDGPTQTFMVRNSGGATTGVPTVVLSGSALGEFALASNACTTPLAAGASCAVAVRFHPTSAGGKAAALAVSATPGGTATASLTGTGLAPASLVGDAPTVDFGTVDLTRVSSSFTWRVHNAGDVATAALTSTVTGDAAQFTVTNGCTGTLAAGAGCTITVAFAPTQAGARTAILTLSSNPGGMAVLTASGVGRAPVGLTVTRSGNGSGAVASAPAGIACGTTCMASFLFDTTVTLTATPQVGSSFTGWTGACTGTAACTVTLSAAQTVNAAFTLNRFPLSLMVGANGSVACGTAACATSYDYGSTVTLTATPAAGYDFAGWGGDCAGAGPCTLTMTQAHAVSASFTIQQIPLTVTVGANGSVSCNGASCAASYPYGTAVTLTATPATGYLLAGWGGDCSGTLACAVTMTASHVVSASFVIRQIPLTVTVGANGTVACNGAACAASYPYGTVVTLMATPATGYQVTWGTDCGGGGACSVMMTAPHTVTASFALRQIALTVTVGANGTVACNGAACAASYPYGTAVTLTATPATGYQVTWGTDCSGSGACVVTMTAPHTVTASFALQQIPLTVTVGPSGTVACNNTTCAASYPYGTTVNLTATPTTGYQVTWGSDCGGGGACSVLMTAPHTVTASFALRQLPLSVTVGANGTVACNNTTCAASYPYGTTVNLTATPSTGYQVTWGTDCSGNGACSVLMTAAHTVTASFALRQLPLTVTVGANGTVACNNTTCAASYPYGTTVNLTATPSTGYQVTWGSDCGGGGACSVLMTAQHTVTASFALQQIPLSVTVGANGTVACNNTTCAASYPYGTTVNLTATPSTGYQVTWGTDCSGNGACSVLMTAQHTVTASFALRQIPLSVTVGANGTVACNNTTCAASYPYGTTVNLTATPSTGYQVTWGTDCSGNGACSVLMTAQHTVTASFALRQIPLLLTVGSNGTVACNNTTCAASYPYGTTVNLTATPSTGYQVTWGTDCGGGGACSVLMTTQHTVTASFALQQIPLTVTPPVNGSILCNGNLCQTSYPYGTPLSITAPGAPHYHLSVWGGDCSNQPATCPLQMTVPHTVSASFGIDQVTLTVTIAGAGAGSVADNGALTRASFSCASGTCSQTYDYGTTLVLVASPDADSNRGPWAGCTKVNDNGTCTVTLNGDASVTANFTTYILTVTVNNTTDGKVTSTDGKINCPSLLCSINPFMCFTSYLRCSAHYRWGASTVLNATPQNGGYFAGWAQTGQCVNQGPACTLTIYADQGETASFDHLR